MTKIFWSWQSDRPGKTGRHFVREALNEAIDSILLDSDINIAESERELHLDHDRQGISGSPDLANAILEKIKASAIFVADVTNIGKADEIQEEGTQKLIMNPNVAIELGYALATVGSTGLLMVMNKAYGGRKTLPFDLSHKAGPILYELSSDATKSEIATEKKKLVTTLKTAIRECINTIKPSSIDLSPPFPEAVPQEGNARFRKAEQPLGVQWEPHAWLGGNEQDIFMHPGAAIWLRLIPTASSGKRWAAQELKMHVVSAGNLNLAPFLQSSSHYLRAEDGFGVYAGVSSDTETHSIAFAFETGEIWAIDTVILGYDTKYIYFGEISKSCVKAIQDFSCFLKSIGFNPPYRWIAGVTGIKNRELLTPAQFGQADIITTNLRYPKCLADEICVSGKYDGTQLPRKALEPFFVEIFKKCGLAFPANLKTPE